MAPAARVQQFGLTQAQPRLAGDPCLRTLAENGFLCVFRGLSLYRHLVPGLCKVLSGSGAAQTGPSLLPRCWLTEPCGPALPPCKCAKHSKTAALLLKKLVV